MSMRFNYEDIRKTLAESETDSSEASIEKALRSFGYSKFPEAGLDDAGASKLISKIVEIEKNEARLMPINANKRRENKRKLIQETGKNGLESQIIKEDLKKFGEGVKIVFRDVTYLTLGVNFALPTMIRKAYYFDGLLANPLGAIMGTFVESLLGYAVLFATNPKLILPVALTQAGTNFASGCYEWVRSIRERTQKRVI